MHVGPIDDVGDSLGLAVVELAGRATGNDRRIVGQPVPAEAVETRRQIDLGVVLRRVEEAADEGQVVRANPIDQKEVAIRRLDLVGPAQAADGSKVYGVSPTATAARRFRLRLVPVSPAQCDWTPA